MSGIDKARNAADKFAGKAKEATGRLTGNRRREAEGRADQTRAGMKQRGEKIKDVFRPR